MRIISKITLSLLCGFTLVLAGCDKSEPYEIATVDEVHLNGSMTRFINIEDPTTPPVTVEIGTTHLPTSDVTVTYQISSPTGATSGVEYSNPSSGTLTIPAGETLTSFQIQPVSSAYGPPPERDTLYVVITQSNVPVSSFGDTLTLIVRRCSEAFVDVTEFLGTYSNTTDFFGSPDGPYTTTITDAVPLTATTGKISVENAWNSTDDPWGRISFILDWTDPANPITTVLPGEVAGSNGGDISSAYDGTTVVVRPAASAPTGTYSFCSQTLTFNMQLGLIEADGTLLGYFGGVYTLNLAR